ncbi:MAG: hypothetical protein KIT58_01880 [Planctomycetota bacterium]|nr:hypothetical protein [Planctomycetota bacterium]
MFPHVDYISTVSGGSYMGAFLASLATRRSPTELVESLEHVPGRAEESGGELRHLRKHASYLSPDGSPLFVAGVSVLLLRGILTNLLLLLPFVVWVSQVAALTHGDWIQTAGMNGWSGWFEAYPLTIIGSAIMLAALLVNMIMERWSRRPPGAKGLAAYVVAPVVLFLAESLPVVAAWYVGLTRGTEDATALSLLFTRLGSVFVGLLPYLGIGLLASQVFSAHLARAGVIVLGLVGPLAMFVAGVTCCAYFAQITEVGDGAVDAARWDLRALSLALTFLALSAWAEAQVRYNERSAKPCWLRILACVGVVLLVTALSLAPSVVTRGYSGGTSPWNPFSASAVWNLEWLVPGVVAGVVYTLTFFLVDANQSSLIWFYKEKLREAYNLHEGASSRPLMLSALANGVLRGGPLPIINAALNLSNPQTSGRLSDFFSFTPQLVGSAATGRIPSRSFERADPRVDLATVVGISGAAVSPSMGAITVRPLVFLMTMLNLRLNYWLPNPRRVGRDDSSTPGRTYLAAELLARLKADTPFVNVSDGGHIENLGVHELLRRRCRLIIACDAEADPGQRCGALATLVRYARIDWGVRIDIDPRAVMANEHNQASAHAVIGKIHYTDEDVGYLVYLKSSLTGDENVYLKDYARRRARYPHETTADQFFDEEQFEAYRALGHHVAEEVFCDWDRDRKHSTVPQREFINEVVAALSLKLSGRTGHEAEFVELQTALAPIEREFAREQIQAHTNATFPELHESGGALDAEALTLCSRQIQFMENVYVLLHLDEQAQRDHSFNRGWINLFRRWARARTFRQTWALVLGMYSPGFQRFCEDALGLGFVLRLEGPLSVEDASVSHECRGALHGVPRAREGVAYRGLLSVPEAEAVEVGLLVVDSAGTGRLLFAYIRMPFRGLRLYERLLKKLGDEVGSRLEVPSDLARGHMGFYQRLEATIS